MEPERVPWDGPQPLAPVNVRAITMALSGMVTALGIAVLTVVPSPYIIEKPGPTFDILSDVDGAPMLTVEGAETYPVSGELRVTTVSLASGAQGGITFSSLLSAWLSPSQAVFPDIVQVAGDSVSREWLSSIDTAAIAALEHQGVDVPVIINVAEVMDGSNALGALEVDDVIVAVNGADIETYPDLNDAMGALTPGDVVTLAIERGGEEVTVSFATVDDGSGAAVMGIWVSPDFDVPLDVVLAIDNVGGSSGGMMFALGILDLLTPVDELRGAKVAGTGTIDVDGTVGPIGGIVQKMAGASEDGAEWFLAPESNCDEVRGRVPDGLRVVAVSTLDEAYDAIVAIGREQASGLSTCS